MCRGRLFRSGSVVYSSRTNPLKRAAAEPQQLEAAHPRRPRQIPARSISIRAIADPGRQAQMQRCRRHRRYGISRRRDLQPLDLRVLFKKLVAEKPAIPLQVVPVEIHRLALDEVLHRVGGDEAGVVSVSVRLPEGVAVQQHQHVGAENRALPWVPAIPVEPVDDDVALAVVVAFWAGCKSDSTRCTSSRRNRAIRNTCRSASRAPPRACDAGASRAR